MEIIIKHEEAFKVILKGRLDTTTSNELTLALNKEEIKENLVIFDFTDLEYISSAGLRVLLALKKQLMAENKNMEIHNINDVIKEVFNVTGFINILTVK